MEYKHIREVDLASNINQRVFVVFMARDVDVRTQSDGTTKYLTLNLCDKDFKIDAKKFGAKDTEIEMMKNGGVYRAAIDVKPYAKAPTGYSCIIYNFEYCDEPASSFVEWAEGMEEAQQVIQGALNTICESIYSKLIANILIPLWNKFTVWTAASSFHHDMLGGLLVHTAEVIDQAEQIGDFWEQKYGPGFIDKPLLLSAAMLHDIGKLYELDVDTTSGTTSYSTQAALGTHITMGCSIIDIEAYKIKLGYQTYIINELNEQEPEKSDETLRQEKEAVELLKHCILAHHGKKEFGSPIDMNCPEAYILNIADGLSAEMYRYKKVFNKAEPGSSTVQWLGGNMVVTYKDSNK